MLTMLFVSMAKSYEGEKIKLFFLESVYVMQYKTPNTREEDVTFAD